MGNPRVCLVAEACPELGRGSTTCTSGQFPARGSWGTPLQVGNLGRYTQSFMCPGHTPTGECPGHTGSGLWSPRHTYPKGLEIIDSSFMARELPALSCQKSNRWLLQKSSTNVYCLVSQPRFWAFVTQQGACMSFCLGFMLPSNFYGDTKAMFFSASVSCCTSYAIPPFTGSWKHWGEGKRLGTQPCFIEEKGPQWARMRHSCCQFFLKGSEQTQFLYMFSCKNAIVTIAKAVQYIRCDHLIIPIGNSWRGQLYYLSVSCKLSVSPYSEM